MIGAMVAAALAAGGADMRAAQVPPPTNIPPAAPARGPALLRQAVLAGHNAVRAAIGVPPLAWSDRLAADADAYARRIAKSGGLAHGGDGAGDQGENLWMGSRGTYGYSQIIALWAGEQRLFVDKPVPGSSRTGRFDAVSHYSQMVWRGSTAVGCAMASDTSEDYLVCRYSPAGNMAGERAY